MPLQYFVQNQDLQHVKQNWKTNPLFSAFLQTFPENADYTIEKLVSEYFKRVEDRHTKHFKQWKEKYIHLALACDELPAQKLIAAWLLGIPPRDKPPPTLYSAIHRTTINTNDHISFLTSEINPHDFRQKKLY